MTGLSDWHEVKEININVSISLKECFVCNRTVQKKLVHFPHVRRSFAEGVFKLALVLGQQWTSRVKVIFFGRRIKRKGVQLAAQRLLITQGTTFGA